MWQPRITNSSRFNKNVKETLNDRGLVDDKGLHMKNISNNYYKKAKTSIRPVDVNNSKYNTSVPGRNSRKTKYIDTTMNIIWQITPHRSTNSTKKNDKNIL